MLRVDWIREDKKALLHRGNWNINTGIPSLFVLLCFTLSCFADIVVFTNLRFVPTLYLPILSMPFFQQYFLTPCLSVTFQYFSQYFKLLLLSLYCFIDLWSIIFNVTAVIDLGSHELQSYEIGELLINVNVSTAQLTSLSQFLALSSGRPIPGGTAILKFVQLITLWCSLCSSGRVRHLSL